MCGYRTFPICIVQWLSEIAVNVWRLVDVRFLHIRQI